MTPFEGFASSDFDAFEERKWASHAFNRERLEAKLKLGSLGKALEAGLGQELAGLEMGVTDERPSVFNQQRVSHLCLYFQRDAGDRAALDAILDRSRSIAQNVLDPAPHHRHVSVGMRLHREGLTAGLWLHRDAWVDWKNAVERCKKYGETERLGSLLQGLPAGVCVGQGEDLPPDAPAAQGAAVEALVAGLGEAQPFTVIGQVLPRAEPALAGPGLVDRLLGLLRPLLPVLRFIAWSGQNDHHQVKAVIQVHKDKVEKQFREIRPGDGVRIARGLAAGRLGVVESLGHKGTVKVRMGPVLLSLRLEDLAPT
ncbi:MAG TPA: hypothetical protein PK668_21145 [Myxococcota bacterium]|nr:hypothetical protein [Myxococcota bacterium]HRY95982.1 hypothetical protein [Myxococcota bacterium]HSA22131.1 hypothetical protein [Myxococcota bacterium]